MQIYYINLQNMQQNEIDQCCKRWKTIIERSQGNQAFGNAVSRFMWSLKDQIRIQRVRTKLCNTNKTCTYFYFKNDRWRIKIVRNSALPNLVDGICFARCPWLLYCIHDNGGEFIRSEFIELLESYDIKPKLATVKNPQSNGLKKMYLILCEMLCTEKIFVPKESAVKREINRILKYTSWVMRTKPNMITIYSPYHLVFERDIIFNQEIIADW